MKERASQFFKIIFVALLAIGFNTTIFAQENYRKTIQKERKEFKVELLKSNEIIFKGEQKKIKKLKYFPIDESWKITAEFQADTGAIFLMPTSTARTPRYQRVGWLHFTHEGEDFKLAGYKSLDLDSVKFKDYVFIPFKDGNAPALTYGGGRYIDVTIEAGTTEVEIDFNTAYNPYCVYSNRFSCPITPEENHIEVKINAGVMNPIKKD